MLIKKTLFCGLSLLFLSNAYPEGFYGGIRGGIDAFVNKRAINNTVTVFGQTTSETIRDRSGKTGAMGGVFLGYNKKLDPYLTLGVELEANLDSTQTKHFQFNADGQFGVKERLKGFYAASIKPAYSINDTTNLYAKVGVARGRFSSEPLLQDAYNLGSSTPFSKWVTGFQYGGGVETLIADNLSLELEYTRIQYKNFSNVSMPASLNKMGEVTLVNSHYHPVSNNLTVGVVYYLNGLKNPAVKEPEHDITAEGAYPKLPQPKRGLRYKLDTDQF